MDDDSLYVVLKVHEHLHMNEREHLRALSFRCFCIVLLFYFVRAENDFRKSKFL